MKKIILSAFLSLSAFFAFSQSITIDNDTGDDLMVNVSFQDEAGLCASDGMITFNMASGEIRTEPVSPGYHVIRVKVSCTDCASVGWVVNKCIFDCTPPVYDAFYDFTWNIDCSYLLIE